jgi:hypothetical protein
MKMSLSHVERQGLHEVMLNAPAVALVAGTVSRTGLTLPENLSVQNWLDVGKQLAVLSDAQWWWIGDWLNGFDVVVLGIAEGDREQVSRHAYEAGVRLFKFARQSLQDFAWVARAVKPSTRVESLGWGHHRAVAGLKDAKGEPDQVRMGELLARALAEGWSVGDLREAIDSREAKGKERGDKPLHGFVFIRWAAEGTRWLHQQMMEEPIEDWSKERREAVRRELQPLVDVYEQLTPPGKESL